MRSFGAAAARAHPDASPESEPDAGAVTHADPDAFRAAQADGNRDDFQRTAIQLEGGDLAG